MLLDCCYSGGLARGTRRSRGLEPPDDIRHRSLQWNAADQMWEPRKLPPLNPALTVRMAGADKATPRLGAAVGLRPLKKGEFDKAREAFGHKGPYMPVVYQSCGPDQLAEEYYHGATPFGVFTFALTTQLRKAKRVTFHDLCEKTAARLKASGFAQTPHVLAADEVLKTIVPWGGAAS